MKQIYVTITILGSVYVSNDYKEEEVEDAIDQFLCEKGIKRDDCDDIEWEEV